MYFNPLPEANYIKVVSLRHIKGRGIISVPHINLNLRKTRPNYFTFNNVMYCTLTFYQHLFTKTNKLIIFETSDLYLWYLKVLKSLPAKYRRGDCQSLWFLYIFSSARGQTRSPGILRHVPASILSYPWLSTSLETKHYMHLTYPFPPGLGVGSWQIF